MEKIEEWRDIENYPDYQISSMGRVKSLKFGKEKILKQSKNKDNYCQMILHKEGKKKHYFIHRLVGQAFIPNPNNYPQINHKNEQKTDNRVDNLEWCDAKYNVNYGTRNKRCGKTNSIVLKGKPNLALSIPIVQIHKSGLIIGVYDSASQASKELNINRVNICNCCNSKRKTCGGFKFKYLNELKKAS